MFNCLYAAGDTLYGKIFLVNGRNHQYFDGTPIVYVAWIAESGDILESFIVKINEGTADLTVPLLRDYGEGRFFLRAYTQYQKNFADYFIFQKEIKVIGETPLQPKEETTDKNNFSIQFFPEGGGLVAGLTARVAFKAVDGQGKPIDITGIIINKNKLDYRTTLYWDSTAKVETKKTTPFSFYTGDKLSEFLIFVEGLTKNGQPFVGLKTIIVAGNSNSLLTKKKLQTTFFRLTAPKV